ncbi:MAG: pentapeptide repeat-containing protein [Cyanobacteria bacterium P01_A01_bin.17]
MAGLPPRWSVILKLGMLLLSAIAVFISTYIGTFVSAVVPVIATTAGKWIAVTLPAVLFFTFIGIVLWRGFGNEMWGFALVITAAVATTFILPNINSAKAIFVLFLFVLAFEIAGVIAGAIAIAASQVLSGRWLIYLLVLVSIVSAPLGATEGLKGASDTSMKWLAITVSILTSTVLIGLSLYTGKQAIVGNSKYSLIRKIAIAVCSYKGTSFFRANLTDANFAKANLRHTDFRDANLTRTRWFQAKHLSQARTDGTYLENPKIRQLVVTLDGQDQNFDHLDLRGLNLKGANLADASFIGTKLSGATLQDANLDRAKLVQTQLYGADLSECSLTGAVIQDWNISTDTKFDGVKCDYVYMQLPTKADPDPCRKPDNRSEIFEPGDFTDFIAPIIKTLDLYQTQNVDLRVVAQQFKTLDLFHHESVDPTVAAIALKKLAELHPEAGIEIVALEGHGDDKVRVQAKVNGTVDRSALSADYAATYQAVSAQTNADLKALLASIKDESIRNFASVMQTVTESDKCFITVNQSFSGDMVHEKSEININSGGGDVSGVVGGNVENVSGTVNLGTVHGDVNNAIGQQQ